MLTGALFVGFVWGRKHLFLVRTIRLRQRPWAVAFSENGKRLAVIGKDGLVVYDSGRWDRLAVVHSIVSSKVCAAGAAGFAYDISYGVAFWPAARQHPPIKLPEEYVEGLAGCKDTIAVCSNKLDRIYDLEGQIVCQGALPRVLWPGNVVAAWSGYVAGQYVLYYLPAESHKTGLSIDVNAPGVSNVAFARPRSEVVTAGSDGQIYTVASPRSRALPLVKPLPAYPYGLAISPDGSLVFLGYKRDLQRRIASERNCLLVVDGRSGRLLERRNLSDGVESLAVDPTGKTLVEANRSGFLRVYEVRDTSISRELRHQ